MECQTECTDLQAQYSKQGEQGRVEQEEQEKQDEKRLSIGPMIPSKRQSFRQLLGAGASCECNAMCKYCFSYQ